MSVDRVATSNQTSYMTSQMLKQEAKVSTLSSQVASGQKSTSYGDYGDQTMAMESARAVVNRTTAYQTATNLALTQTELQDNQLSQLSDLAEELKTACADAVSSGDGSTLSTSCSDIFDQVKAILNYKDSNGSYLYGGGNDSSAPFTVDTFSDLSSATLSDSFTVGSSVKSVQVSDSENVDIGVSATDIGTSLMSTLQEISQYISTNGDFTSTIDSNDETLLTTAMTDSTTAYESINQVMATNGTTYSRLETAADTQTTMLTLYTGFVSDIQDVDMSTAASDLSNAKVALQAVVQVTSTLNDITLLNYLS
jgi:flagellar hook-associated protein 3 FlgL